MNEPRLVELLNAYLDRELSESQRREVETMLRDGRAQHILDELDRIAKALQSLPAFPVPESIRDRWRARACRDDGLGLYPTAAAFLQEILNQPGQSVDAYADRRLTQEQRRDVEENLLIRDDHRRALKETRAVRRQIHGLRKLRVPAKLLEATMRQIRQFGSPDQPRRGVPARPDAVRTEPRLYRAVGLVAAALALAFATLSGLIPNRASQELVSVPVERFHETPIIPDEPGAINPDHPQPPTNVDLLVAKKVKRATPVAQSESHERNLAVHNEKRPQPQLSLDTLAKLRPGELVTLDDQQISLVCVDVQQVADRLHVTMTQAGLANRSEEPANKPLVAQQALGEMYVFEIQATPAQIGRVFEELQKPDQATAIIDDVRMTEPAPPPSDPKNESQATVATIAPLNPPLATPYFRCWRVPDDRKVEFGQTRRPAKVKSNGPMPSEQLHLFLLVKPKPDAQR